MAEAKQDIGFFAEDVLDICGFVTDYLTREGTPELRIQKLNWHHYEWFQFINSYKRIGIMAPRDHWKTSIFSVVFPLWRLLHGENTFIFSNSQAQANDVLDRCKFFLENHWVFQGYKPQRPAIWHKRAVRCANGATLVSRGFGTAVRGAHPHNVVVDDPLSENPSMTDEYIKRFFNRAVVSMVPPGGWNIVVGTPQKYADFLMELMKNKEYFTKRYVAVLDWDAQQVLWPEYYSWVRLMQKRRQIGELAFSQEFQTNPMDEQSSLFPMRLISACFDEGSFAVWLYEPLFNCEFPGCKFAFYRENLAAEHMRTHGAEWVGRYMRPLQTFIGVDLALSTAVGADYYCAITLGVDRRGNRYILDVYRAKGLSYTQQVNKLIELNSRYKPGLILVESNQYQKVIVDMAQDISAIPVKQWVTGYKKSHLEEGVPGLRVLFENLKFRIPRGDDESRLLMEPLIRELRAFGYKEGKVQGVGEHDDAVMALYIADQAVKQWEGTRLKYATLEM